jgi:CobQ-like glutamine amidotransferase family enzyme
MSNAWDSLKQPILDLLKSSVSDFVDTEKVEVQSFLAGKADQVAQQTWLSVNGSDDDKVQAISNLRHLKSQVIMEAASQEIVATTAAIKLLGKVFEVVANFVLQYGTKLLLAA